MLVTWLVEIEGRRGRQELCRSEAEAATLVLELFLLGVPRKKIIVDGKNLRDMGASWVLDALGL